jgi:hypothetical protein
VCASASGHTPVQPQYKPYGKTWRAIEVLTRNCTLYEEFDAESVDADAEFTEATDF